MGKMRRSGRRREEQDRENGWEIVREAGTELYLFLMLAVYPLFLVNGYSDLVYKKWELFLYASALFLLMSVVCAVGIIVSGKKSRVGSAKKIRTGMTISSLSGTDWFVIVYLICAVISYIGAVDQQIGLWGVDTWYMGLISQILFVGIYFGISRGYSENKYIALLMTLVGIVVNSLVIFQRFGFNVFHLYDGYGDDVKLDFVTTLGQVTWSSSYISILLVAIMGIYYLTKDRKQKIFWGISMGIGFASEILLNCDSGVIALLVAWMIMLWMALGSRERMLALLETVLIALTTTAVVGIPERMFAHRMIPIDAIYLKVAQSPFIYLLLVLVFIAYLLVRSNRISVGANRGTVCVLRGIYIALVCLGIIGIAVLFILHEKNYFVGSPSENYFRFTIWWGNSRGFIWRTGAAVFADFDIWRKLFGCGPDCFTPYAYELMGEAIDEFWHNQIVPNVHNEWFNALINYGIVGGMAYLGIFVSAAWAFMRKAVNDVKDTMDKALLFGTGLAAAGYVAHNVLCYQQIIGTPLIFVLLGIGAAIGRRR